MPLTNYGEQQVLQQIFGTPGSLVLPASGGTWYLGLIAAKYVHASGTTGVAVNDIVIPPTFSANNFIYKVSSLGSSAGVMGTVSSWSNTANVTDSNGIVYTPVAWQAATTASTTSFYVNANVISAEVSGTSYARATLTNTTGVTSSTNTFFTPTIPTGTSSPYYASTYYNNTISFTQSGGSWGNVCGFFLATTATIGTGSSIAWNTLTNYVPVTVSGITVQITSGSTGLQIQLT